MSEQYVQGMREMRLHFGKASDKWIEVIHDIYPEFAKVIKSFPLESFIVATLYIRKLVNFVRLRHSQSRAYFA